MHIPKLLRRIISSQMVLSLICDLVTSRGNRRTAQVKWPPTNLTYTHVTVRTSTFVAPLLSKRMTDVNADILFAYVGIIITATVSVFAGSFGSLPVSPPSVNRASLFNWSSSLGMMSRSRRVARRMMVTRTRIPSLD